jgi:hypothetical protein
MGRKYEPPGLMPLGAPLRGVGGSCSGGANPGGADPNCMNGGTAGGICQAGNSATSLVCVNGGTAGERCQPGGSPRHGPRP